MDREIILKLGVSASALALIYIVSYFVRAYARKVMVTNDLSESRYIVIRKLIAVAALFICLVFLSYVWGIEIKNLWLSVTGLLAMVAIAFFAVWSLVGNILAGIIIYFTTPFKIDDLIEIQPEGIKGRVFAINSFFTLLVDEDNNYFNVPNSLFFQKFLKVYNRKKKNKA